MKELAQLLRAVAPGSRVQVGVDGVDCSGKTTLADRLADELRPHRPVVRASIDGFHRPRAERYRRGRESAEGCYLDTFDLPALHQRLLDPFAAGLPCQTVAFDLHADAPLSPEPVLPAADAVLLVDGVFLLRPELAHLWDLVLHLRVPEEEVLRRAALRDGADALPLYRTRYLPAQRLYEAECSPADRADVVIDNTDVRTPRVVRQLKGGT